MQSLRTSYFSEARAVLFCVLLAVLASSCTQHPVYPAPTVIGQNVVIDTASLQPEVPKFFSLQYEGKKVTFFVLRVHDSVSSFLDACMTCYPHRMGYRNEDAAVTCRYCNMKFSIFKLEKGIGGCYPIKIEGKTDKGSYLIPLSVLEKEADKF
jgi:uncharacterized membrane protein